jgi:hypothetical protein
VASRPIGGVLSAGRQAGTGGVAIHLSGLPGDIGRATRPTFWPCSGWGLPSRPGRPGRWCALTAPFHPCLCTASRAIGGLFSVALSCGSPRLAVSQHPALWSPDLPQPAATPKRRPGRGHPADSPSPLSLSHDPAQLSPSRSRRLSGRVSRQHECLRIKNLRVIVSTNVIRLKQGEVGNHDAT